MRPPDVWKQLTAPRRALVQLARAGAVVAGVAVYLKLKHGTLSRLLLALGHGDTPLHDFHDFFFPTGAALSATPVDGWVYSAMAALFFAPFGALPYAIAAWLWALVLLSLTAALAWESARPAREHGRDRLALLGIGLTVGSMPVLHDLKFGQVSVLLVVALLGCLAFHERGRPLLASACLAFAASFKFYPALFLVYFVFRRDTKVVVATLLFSFLFLVVAPVLALGPAGALAFHENVSRQIAERFGSGIKDINSQSFASLADRLVLQRWNPEHPWLAPALTAARFLVCGGLLAVVYRLARSARPDAARWAFLWLFAATPFFVSTSWPHYFVYLPLLVVSALDASQSGCAPRVARVGGVAASLGAAALSSMPVFDLIGNRQHYSRLGALFFANLLAIVALGLALPDET